MRYFPAMGSILIRNVDDQTKALLRRRAADHGRSMEAEARTILCEAVEEQAPQGEPKSLVDLAREIFGKKGVDLEIPPRTHGREPPDFSE
jgi:plasmid stability protein